MARAPERAKKTADPAVVLDLVLRSGFFFFVLENRGGACVHDVQVSFRRSVPGPGGEVDLTKLPLWSRLSFMPPGKRIDVPIDRSTSVLAQRRLRPLSLTIRYRDASGTLWSATIAHDFEAYRNLPDVRWPDPP